MREIRRQRQKTHSVKKMKPENFLVFAVAFLCSLYSQVLALCGQDMEQQSLMLCDKPFELAQKSRVHEFPLSLGEET